MNETINYYNTNSTDFYNSTVSVDMSEQYEMFEKHLAPKSKIMDCGCGSGRDTLYFFNKGYTVFAMDASSEMCAFASKLTNTDVKCMRFDEINFENTFDGVWACSSLLHNSLADLKDTLLRLSKALKDNGVLYASFKYGEFSGKRNGRYFTDLNEDIFNGILHEINCFELIETKITVDVRPDRDEKWLNVILIKKTLA